MFLMQKITAHIPQKLRTLLPQLMRIALCFLCGAMLVLAMPPYHIWPVAFLAYSLFFFLFAQDHAKPFLYGFAFGFGAFFFGLIWIGNALLVEGNPYRWAYPLAILALPLLLSTFPAIACTLSKRYFGGDIRALFFGFVSLLSLSEILRGVVFTGFPWNVPAYIWAGNDPVSTAIHDSLAIGGTAFLSTLTIFWCTSPALLFISQLSKSHRLAIISISILTCGMLAICAARILPDHNMLTTKQNTVVKVVQPNIKQEDKWRRDKMRYNLDKLIALSRSDTPPNNIDGNRISQHTTLIIWPETALTSHALQSNYATSALRDMLSSYDNAYLITGMMRVDEDSNGTQRYYNSIAVLNRRADIVALYNKSHLVPFGEYIPFQDMIPLETVTSFSGFEKGDGNHVITFTDDKTGNPLSFAGLVCYEVIFPSALRTDFAQTPQPSFIVNVTNDAWYGDSAGPPQHLAKAKFRAIEYGRPLFRSANTGISAIINSDGRIMDTAPLNSTETITADLAALETRQTIYATAGGAFSLFILFCGFILSFLFNRLRDE